MLYETERHTALTDTRWDAQRAIGLSPKIDTAFADDGVDEYWAVMLPRMLSRESKPVPSSVIGVSLSDTGTTWTIDGRGGSVQLADDGVETAATRGACQSSDHSGICGCRRPWET